MGRPWIIWKATRCHWLLRCIDHRDPLFHCSCGSIQSDDGGPSSQESVSIIGVKKNANLQSQGIMTLARAMHYVEQLERSEQPCEVLIYLLVCFLLGIFLQLCDCCELELLRMGSSVVFADQMILPRWVKAQLVQGSNCQRQAISSNWRIFELKVLFVAVFGQFLNVAMPIFWLLCERNKCRVNALIDLPMLSTEDIWQMTFCWLQLRGGSQGYTRLSLTLLFCPSTSLI